MCIAKAGSSQSVVVDTISAKQPWPPNDLYTFPLLSIAGHRDVAERINRDLARDLLEVDPDTLNGSIFHNIWGDAATSALPRSSSLVWSYSHPFPDLLTFAFSGEACAAFCEGFAIHRVYDMNDGHRLEYDALFTVDGLAVVDDTVGKSWRRIVSAQVEVLEDSIKADGLSPEVNEWLGSALAKYRACLGERPMERPYVADLELLESQLRLHIARCSVHADRNADDLDQVTIELSYDWLAPYLSPEVSKLIK